MEDKTMKRTILSTMMCVMMTLGVSAQVQDSIARQQLHQTVCKSQMKRGKISAEQRAELKAKFITQKLSLTSEQNQKLNTIYLNEIENFRQNKAVIESSDQAARKEIFKNIKTATNKQIKEVLTEEQYTQYREIGKKRHEAIKNMKRHHHNHNNKAMPRIKHSNHTAQS